MKKILVPCDFSSQSQQAFQAAMNIATQANAIILLLHVLPSPALYTTGVAGEPLALDPSYFARMEDDAKKELEKMAKKSDRAGRVRTQVEYGSLTAAIENTIATHSIDLVVMGTSGASGVKELFIGSNTEKVVRFSPVPVLTIRNAPALKSIKDILVPSTLDLNQTEFIHKLQELREFFGATLHILVVNTPAHFRSDAEGREALDAFVKHYSLNNVKVHFRNYLHEDSGIASFAVSEKMDLLAMATHARKGLAHLFSGSVTENVVNHLSLPIWSYRLKSATK
jgi:nucleotide-binding universal stress UspA family protein